LIVKEKGKYGFYIFDDDDALHSGRLWRGCASEAPAIFE
jgi:hypothetical protein